MVASSQYHEASAEPNLTPMLDMVFQLVTFFMLVINFKSAQIDMNLKLPVVGSARPVDTKGQEDLLVLNIDKDGRLTVYNTPKDIDSYIAGEAQSSLLAARRTQPGPSAGRRVAHHGGDSGRPRYAISPAQSRDQGLPGERFSQLLAEGHE